MEESVVSKQEHADENSDKEEPRPQEVAAMMKPVMKFVNGKAVLEMPKTISTSKAIESIKNTMGPSVV